MNTARLARHWQDASGDPVRMAEALGDEINDPAAGLVSRDYLVKRLAEFETRLSNLLFDRTTSQTRWLIALSVAQFVAIMIAVVGLYFR